MKKINLQKMEMKMNKDLSQELMEKKMLKDMGIEGIITRVNSENKKRYLDLVIDTKSINEEEMTVEVMFATEDPYMRWFGFEVVSSAGQDLKRLNDGGPLLYNHDRDIQIGMILRAWVGDDKKTRALVKFIDDEEGIKYFNRVKKGFLNKLSYGYLVKKMELTEINEEGPDTYTVTECEVYEVSFVTIPADPATGVGRDLLDQTPNEQVVNVSTVSETEENKTLEDGEMSDNNTTVDTPNIDEIKAKAKEEGAAQVRAEIEAKAARDSQIRNLCKVSGIEEKEMEAFVTSEKSLNEVLNEISAIQAKKSEKQNVTTTQTTVEVGAAHTEKRMADMKEALLGASLKGHKTDVNFTGFERMAHEICRIRGIDSYKFTKNQLVNEIMKRTMGTDDFPLLMGDVQGKILMDTYNGLYNTMSFLPLLRQRQVQDFKTIKPSRLSESSELKLKLAGEEYSYVDFSETQEEYKVATYGIGVKFTREAFINDDLGALDDVANFASSVIQTENTLFWDKFHNDVVEGNPIFDAAHANIGTGDLDIAGLSEGRRLMRLKTGLKSTKPLNLGADLLIVPAAKETLAQQFTSSAYVPNTAGTQNVFAGTLSPIADAQLDAYATNKWYLASTRLPSFERAVLAGESAPVLDSVQDFDTDALKSKIRFNVGYKCIDHRPLVEMTDA